MQPVVQVAIDVTSMEEAMSLAKSAIRAGADWLEAGTPFIQVEGMRGIRELRAGSDVTRAPIPRQPSRGTATAFC